MKETIILTNRQYEAELLRTCAKYGSELINTRVLDSLELADYSLSKNNKYISNVLISEEDETCIYYKHLTEPSIKEKLLYFKSDSYLNAEKVVKGINNLRTLLTCTKELEFNVFSSTLMNGTFKDKNIDLCNLFYCYIEYKNRLNLLDKIDFIRQAIKEADKKVDELIILNDLELSPLEIELAHAVSKQVRVMSYKDLYKKSTNTSTLNITKARGKINEVLNAYKYIRDNSIPYDKCLFVTLDKSYDEVINNISCKLNIGEYDANGVSNIYTYPVKLYTLYNAWNERYFNNIDSLKAMINSKYFKKDLLFDEIEEAEREQIIKECGSMKIGNDDVSNMKKLNDLFSSTRFDFFELYYNSLYGLEKLDKEDYKEHLTHVVKELSLYTPDFIAKYYVPRKDYQDEENDGLKIIYDKYELIKKAGIKDKVAIEEVINMIHSGRVSTMHSEPGNIYVTDLNKAPATLRDYVFIFGMSSDIFPGKLKEDYVVLDSDYHLFDDNKYQHTSENILLNKTNDLLSFVSLVKEIGCELNISYSNFDISEVKDLNPASVLYEIYKLYNENATVKEYENTMIVVPSFFESGFFKDDFIGKNHLEGKYLENVVKEETEKSKIDTSNLFNFEYSPSYIETLINQCPLKFFYEKICSIKEEDEDNPFEVITDRERGNLAHLNMEILKMNPEISKDDFLDECRDSFDSYMKARVAFDEKMVKKEKDLFVKMMDKEYDIMHDKDIEETEIKVSKKHEKDGHVLKIGGRLDCLYKENDGSYIIVDYKTGVNVKHKDEDPKTCLQALLYAYMFEDGERKVSRVEYHYLRYGKIIKCDFTDEIKEKIKEILNNCIDMIALCNFPKKDAKQKNKICEYCKHKGTCDMLK